MKKRKEEELQLWLEQYKNLRAEQGFEELTKNEESEYIKTIKKLEDLNKIFDL